MTNAQRPGDAAMKRFPLYRAEGGHRRLGRLHGEQAAEKIKAHLDYMSTQLKLSPDEIRERAARFEPLFERHCPHLLEELAGLAEGAGIELAEAVAVNTRSALASAEEGGCTAFVVGKRGAAEREILIGQNSDMLPAMLDFAYVLHLRPEGKPEALMWTFGGMIGYHGINSHGIGQFANDLGGGPTSRFAMPHYPLKRLMLERERLDEVVELLRTIPVWANANYVLCDGAGEILDIESTSVGCELISDEGVGYLAHSNHFIGPVHATPENHERSAADSFTRLQRMNELVRGRFGAVTVDDLKSFLRDRAGDPSGICRFAQTTDPEADWQTAGMTIASIIAEPAQRRLHVAFGNEAETPFVAYSMDED